MNKKPILSKRPIKLIAFILVCLIAITLTGCDSSNKRPNGGIDLNATYASVGEDYSVTVGDVYNKLRYNAIDYIENRVYNFLYEEEINTLTEELKKDPNKYKEEFHHEILHDIYDVHDEEDLEDLSEKAKDKAISKYVDEMYQKGFVISADDIKDEKFENIYPYYYLGVAKHIAAEKKLVSEVGTYENDTLKFNEITDDSYFTKEDVVDWYESNYENTGDITAILIRFISSDEANEVLKKFGLKMAGNKWYQIKLSENGDELTSKNAYDKYYDDYKINLTGNEPLSSIDKLGNGRATVLKVYAAIYNYIYTYREDKIVLDSNDRPVSDFASEGHLQYYRYLEEMIENDMEIRKTDENNTKYEDYVKELKDNYADLVVMDKERMDKYSSSLRNYISTSLKTKADEEGKAFTQYLTSTKSYSNYSYLVFKIDQVEDKKLYDEEEKDGKNEITFTDTEFLNEILNEMFEAELDDAYVNEVFEERVKEVKKLRIYDSIIESQFMYTSTSLLAESYKKNKKQNNDIIAELTYKDKPFEIKASDMYSYLEPLHGPQVASTLLFQQYIKDTDYYKDLQEDYNDYVETVKLMLYYFANDFYASSGYPSTIGKYNFMMLYFGSADIDVVVKDFLMVSDATNAYFNDIAERAGDDFYGKLETYTKKEYEKFYSLTASGLSVYADRDEDGEPDENLMDIKDENGNVLAELLLQDAYEAAINMNKAYATALNDVVTEFKKSSRILDNDNPISPESKWAKYRAAGLYIEVTSFNTITNASDSLDTEIQTRIEELYDVVMDSKLGFTSAYLDTENQITNDNKLTRLLITGGALPTSAMFDDEESLEIYKEIDVIIGKNKETVLLDYSLNEITEAQIKVYVAEYVLFGDVYSLPSSTKAALDAYILPLISKYKGQASQQKLIEVELGNIEFNETGALSTLFNDAFRNEYKEKGRAGFADKYNEILQKVEDDYETPYENWWTDMYVKGGSN